MRIILAAAILLLLTACGAQGAPAPQAAVTLPGSQPPAATAAPLAVTATGAATTGAGGAPTAASQVATSAATTGAGGAPTAANAAPAPSEYTAANGDRVRGLPSAPITMLDYSDFQ